MKWGAKRSCSNLDEETIEEQETCLKRQRSERVGCEDQDACEEVRETCVGRAGDLREGGRDRRQVFDESRCGSADLECREDLRARKRKNVDRMARNV